MTEEEKAKKAKEYREKNKTKRKEISTQKVKCCICNSVLSRQCWKRHTKSLFHINALKLNSSITEEYEIIEEDEDDEEYVDDQEVIYT